MRLANLVPSISADLVTALNTVGIRTESDLLFSATPREILSRLPPKTVSMEDLEAVIDIVAELSAAPGVSCFDLFALEGERDALAPLVSGKEDIDRMLSELGRHKIIQLSGDKGSGKSILALNLAVNLLACHNGSKVAWINTTGDFSVEALNDILSVKQLASTILDRLQVSLAFDLEIAQVVLEELFQSDSKPPLLLVIDCITPLLAPLLSATSAQGHAIMTDFMRHLQYQAQNSRTTVLLLNSTSRKDMDTQERKPALGPSFALLVDGTLWIQSRKQENSEDSFHSLQILSARAKVSMENFIFCFKSNVVAEIDFSGDPSFTVNYE